MQLLGVQIGAIQPLQVGDRQVISGFRKRAARGPVPVGALGLAVDVPGSLEAGQAFEIVPGPRETPVMELFKAVRAKVG